MSNRKKVLIIGDDPQAGSYYFTSDEYEWAIYAKQLPIVIIAKSKKDNTMIRIYTIETVEEKVYEE